jgi:hypothetical protein
VLVVIDGKTMRGAIPNGESSGVHLLAAYLPEEGVVLAKVAIEAKYNEEDRTRTTNQRFAEVLSILNNFVVSLTQKLQLANMAFARRQFDAQITELLARVHDY